MSWHSVRVRPSAAPDAVLAALFAAGSLGVQEERETLLTHFPPETDIGRVAALVRAADAFAAIDVGTADDVDWSERWKDRVTRHDLGALSVAPPWLVSDARDERTIVIDPGMAFGTGEHATTRGMIRLMQGVIRHGDVVADLGAGSAVLAIAAVKLGAARAAAIELDADAIGNADANVARNAVGGRVQVIEGDAETLLPLVAPVRVVLANILSSVLIQLLPVIGDSLTPDGVAILSGMLVDERAHMIEILTRTGWTIGAEDREELWWSTVITRA